MHIFTKILIVFGLVIVCQSRLIFESLSNRIVTTRYGKLRGVLVDFKDPKLQQVEAYLGIEYASLHGGNLRFLPPSSPLEKWDGVKIANYFRPVCPQQSLDFTKLLEEMPLARVERLQRIAEFTKSQSEDCLYLNVYIPARDRKGPAPVAVFIHGESYDYGTGNAYDGSAFAAYADMAIVTLNYRLGPLGFLSTGDNNAAGNYALFDLVAALHWVQANIADFGGDSTKITIIGQGYGAALANLLSLTPMAKGLKLFNRMILQSGSALTSWSMAGNPQKTVNELANSLKCMPPHSEDEKPDTALIVQCLKNIPSETLMNTNVTNVKYLSTYGPVVDRNLIQDLPEKLMEKKGTLFSEIMILFGVAKYEGSSLLSQHQLEKGIDQETKEDIIRTYVNNTFQFHRQEIFDILLHHYNNWEGNPMDKRDTNKHKIIEMLGDAQYNVPVLMAGNYQLKHSREAFFYVFSHSSRQQEFPNWQGGHHGEELSFVFGAPVGDWISPFVGSFSRHEKLLSQATMRFWGNFIKSGNPNIPLLDPNSEEVTADNERFLGTHWPAYDKSYQRYLNLGMRPLINHSYRSKRYALWTDLIAGIHQQEVENMDVSHHLLKKKNSTAKPSGGTRGFGVRHVLPPPPTPPLLPPLSKNTTIFVNKPLSDASQDIDLKEPEKKGIATKVVERILYENVTRIVTQVVAVEEEPTLKLPLSFTITVTVGCALLFINLCVLIGIYCLRDKMKTERKALERLKQNVVIDNGKEIKKSREDNSSTNKTRQMNITENCLSDKTMEMFDKMSKQESYNSERGSLKSNRSSRRPEHRDNSPQKSYTSPPPREYVTNSYQPHTMSTEVEDFPQPPRAFYDSSDNNDPEYLFETCSSYRRPTPRSKNGSEASFTMRSDYESDQDLRTFRPPHTQSMPIPRQRPPNGLMPSPRTHVPMGTFTTPRHSPRRGHHPEERYVEPQKTPRRMQSADGISSDSGIQHISYGLPAV